MKYYRIKIEGFNLSPISGKRFSSEGIMTKEEIKAGAINIIALKSSSLFDDVKQLEGIEHIDDVMKICNVLNCSDSNNNQFPTCNMCKGPKCGAKKMINDYENE